MASTRNRNTPGDYANESRRYQQYLTVCAQGPMIPYVYHPGNGLLGHRCPAERLADNAVDVESVLRGIGATDLVTPRPDVVPQTRTLKTWDLGERPALVMPEPLRVPTGARPGLWTAKD